MAHTGSKPYKSGTGGHKRRRSKFGQAVDKFNTKKKKKTN